MEENKGKLFYLFLFLNAFFWTLLESFRNIIGNDALEAISWGELISFGTNKHPPMSGWLAGGIYNLFGQSDIAIYLLGQICILVGFIFLYKLAKFFLTEEKAICSTLVLSSCYYFTYVAFYENFNCNFLSMALWPMIAYYYYKSIKEDKLRDWILFGIAAAFGVLTKYQVIFLYLALFLHLLLCERKQFKKKGMYAAIGAGFLVILPHVIWLFQHEFFSFIYMAERTEVGANNTPQFLIKYGRVVFPIKFYLDQLLSVASCIGLYLLLAWQAGNIKFLKTEGEKSEKIFILSIGLLPILMQGGIALISNSRIQGMWGSMMVSFAGLLLFYFFPIEFNKNTFKFCLKLAYVFMFGWLIAMAIFLQCQAKLHMSFPYQTILPEFDRMWAEKTNNAELKYVGGDINYAFKFRNYGSNHPRVILETFGYKNPWVNHEDVLKSGAIIIGRKEADVARNVRDLIILLPEKYEITPYKYEFKIKSKFKKTKKFKFYYTIIPPMD
ncbi:glycosyltransferase family 39 protein [bacterium]|nr:glycosyltransferase family 39 protein [bacterium]